MLRSRAGMNQKHVATSDLVGVKSDHLILSSIVLHCVFCLSVVLVRSGLVLLNTTYLISIDLIIGIDIMLISIASYRISVTYHRLSFLSSHLCFILSFCVPSGMLVFLGMLEHSKPFLSNSSQNGSQLPSSLFLV